LRDLGVDVRAFRDNGVVREAGRRVRERWRDVSEEKGWRRGRWRGRRRS
jgi:hypothetical protein